MKRFLGLMLLWAILLSTINAPSARGAGSYETKATTSLIKALCGRSDDVELEVYIVLEDVDSKRIMARFEEKYPDEYTEYIAAKETDTMEQQRQAVYGSLNLKNDYQETESCINAELLQQAIETKRRLFSEDYLANNSIIAELLGEESIVYISQYAPMVIAYASEEEIKALCQKDSVKLIDLYEEPKFNNSLENSNIQSGAAYVRDVMGNKGLNVKIGQIELAVPKDVADLANTTVIKQVTSPQDDHATRVARIMVGQEEGIAPKATLYCTAVTETNQFYPAVEWLLYCGVNIINMSMESISDYGYTMLSKWVDHIAMQHDVHIVIAAGNNGNYINELASAYNAITVGGFNDCDNDNPADDEMCSFSAYAEYNGSGRPEKPNLIASANKIDVTGLAVNTSSGTSFAAPQVAGIIAQLCSYKPELKTKQSAMGAILAAGAFKRIGTFSNDHITGSTQINDRQGAGKINARGSRSIAVAGNWWRQKIAADSFPFIKTVSITADPEGKVRIAIFWLKQNTFGNTWHASSVSINPLTNLDLRVYAPDGSLLRSSTTQYSNYEIVQFTPTQTGTYKIKISKATAGTSLEEIVGIAIW